MIAVGLMAGTSLDGIDVALVEIVPRGPSYGVNLVRFATVPFAADVERRLRAAVAPGLPSPQETAALDADVGAAFGDAALAVAAEVPPAFVASHGVTLFHDGVAHRTVQIGDPYAIRERIGATVLWDFRRADCAAGGHGAPLVPYVDALLLSSAGHRAVLNLGGIANVTLLAPGAAPADALAWDVGPANMLVDGFVRDRTGGRERCDRDGVYALRGAPNAEAVAAMLCDPYFAAAPPKSTGRERFGDGFAREHAALLAPLSLEDGCATLTALSAAAIARDLGARVPPGGEVLVAGGGRHNRALMQMLRASLAPRSVEPVERAGMDGDAKEAVAFAVLGYELLRERPAGLPAVTGARAPALLGAIAPHRLAALLERVAEEVRAAGRQRRQA